MPNVVVTGASRGIGLAVTRHLLHKFNANVVAISRSRTPELIELSSESLLIVECDVSVNSHFLWIYELISSNVALTRKLYPMQLPLAQLIIKDLMVSSSTQASLILFVASGITPPWNPGKKVSISISSLSSPL